MVDGAPTVTATALEVALERGREALWGAQDAGGWWTWGTDANATLGAGYVFALHALGLLGEASWAGVGEALGVGLRGEQQAAGGWSLVPGGPACVSTSAEAYVALRLLGDAADAPHMVRAREVIRGLGGPSKARVLTRFQLAVLGLMDWRACPSIPVQMLLAPRLTRLNLYELACWARACTVPLAVLADVRFEAPVPGGWTIEDLFPTSWSPEALYETEEAPGTLSWAQLFRQADRLIKWTERKNLRPLRGIALRRAEAWILAQQDPGGSWAGIAPATAWSLVALRALGHDPAEEVLQRGLQALRALERPAGDGLRVAACSSPVWDTAWTSVALVESGGSVDDPRLQRGLRWLEGQQAREPGGWSIKAPDAPAGGWPIQFDNVRHPDTHDTALAMLALTNATPSETVREALDLGRGWLVALQNSDGGWGAFEREVDAEVLDALLYSDDQTLLDPSTADLTGRVLDMLGTFGAQREDPVVARAESFVRRAQTASGAWWGRWGVNYVFGTWSALSGLRAIGVPVDDAAIARAGDWLASVQNDDGGFGESCASYAREEFVGAPSTVSQTSWGLLGLILAGRGGTTAAELAAAWLVAQQDADGAWSEEAYTGTGFPNAFYLRYAGYPRYFPLLALGVYRNARRKN